MAHHRKEDTSPATKADIAHVLDKLGALATAFDEHRKSFAEHDKVMQAQIKTVLDLMDGRFDEMDEKFSELFTKLDDACFNKSIEQDASIRNLSRRVATVERRLGIAA